MNTRFLNLHVLTTASIANQNRDDSGTPKQVTYGGAIRHRWSSQALTRAKRVTYEIESGGDQTTWRAKGGMTDLALSLASDLAEQNGQPLTDDETTALQTSITERITALVTNKEKARKNARAAKNTTDDESPDNNGDAGTPDDEDGDGKKATLVWLAEHEVTTLARNSLATLRTGASPSDFVNAGGRTTSLSIAAFGRMFAFRPDLQNEAAVQRSHAFTTHVGDIEPDYFTAVNDLPAKQDGSGAGHLDLSQFSGGVYYWHANLDRDQLWKTWIAPSNDDDTRKRLVLFFEALLQALPSGKQATTAPKTVPDAVLAVPATSPVALHQAFEAPIRSTGDGYRHPSLAALLATHDRVRSFTPRQFADTAHLAGTIDAKPYDHITTQPSLDALIDACVTWTLAGRTETSR
ncbi:type I-E CRISPR-associated protein Cas7/Cse4/CasC [Amycolatopsis lurida]